MLCLKLSSIYVNQINKIRLTTQVFLFQCALASLDELWNVVCHHRFWFNFSRKFKLDCFINIEMSAFLYCILISCYVFLAICIDVVLSPHQLCPLCPTVLPVKLNGFQQRTGKVVMTWGRFKVVQSLINLFIIAS